MHMQGKSLVALSNSFGFVPAPKMVPNDPTSWYSQPWVVSSYQVWYQGWPVWTIQHGKSDGMLLSSIGYTRHQGFHLGSSPSFLDHFSGWSHAVKCPMRGLRGEELKLPANSHVNKLEEDPPAWVKSSETATCSNTLTAHETSKSEPPS